MATSPPKAREMSTTAQPSTIPPASSASNAIDIIFLHNNTVTHREILHQSCETPTATYSDLHSTIRSRFQTSQASPVNVNSVVEIFPPPPQPSSSVIGGITGIELEEVRAAAQAHQIAYEVHKAALEKAARAAAAQVIPELTIEVHGAAGLRAIETEEAWEGAKREVRDAVWMAGYMKVLVTVVDGSSAS
jgi:hypothetical protein